MSELVTTPGVAQYPDYGLQVISEQPVTLRQEPGIPASPRTATGGDTSDFIAPIDPNDSTIFNIDGGGGIDTLMGAAGTDSISGGAGNDTVLGSEGDDTLSGEEGSDTIVGELGNDTIDGGSGKDTLNGGDGNDVIAGGGGADRINGAEGDDVLRGEGGQDRIIGGAGDDLIEGGRGQDKLTGGEGQDTFRFEQGATGGKSKRRADQITDFDPTEDLIQLDKRLVPELNEGQLSSEDFQAVERLTQGVTAKLVYERSSGLLYYNPGQGSDIILLQLDKNLNITSSDFEIF